MLPTFIRPAGERRTPLSKFCDNFIFAVRKAVLPSLSPELFIRVYKTVVYFVMFFGKPLGVSNQVKTQFSQSWYVILLYKY